MLKKEDKNLGSDKKKRERMENPGIDPGTSHMLSERSTIWANPPTDSSILEISVFVISLRFCTDYSDEWLTLKTSADIFFTTLSIITYITFSSMFHRDADTDKLH